MMAKYHWTSVVCGPRCSPESYLSWPPNRLAKLNGGCLSWTNSGGNNRSSHVPWCHTSSGSRELVPMCKPALRGHTSQLRQLNQEEAHRHGSSWSRGLRCTPPEESFVCKIGNLAWFHRRSTCDIHVACERVALLQVGCWTLLSFAACSSPPAAPG